ncbi:SpoIIE family protein phosphatase [Salisediminibacterium selenitireducens]|uniref:Stage II sporulation E family protein n=1 Tax=Bacillus selenitireducens (strain ATCC 700615 / DSM 15326 / MLS10) TaxID=439292 RepID=D6XY03_BACIE|nr:SpoIIE family protein phosphatase [Salisediminibacterium selenitireducens]ADH98076.1 Stage II sporulation E family protein [[Bacillus] selenitireducens MLS10]
MIEHQLMDEMDISVYQNAKKGNWCSGDAVYIVRTSDYILVAVTDGLGSGHEAQEASESVMAIIRADHDLPFRALLDRCNNAVWGTRGVVLSILKFDFHSQQVEYINVGNITCTFYYPDGKMYRPIPSRGYLSGRKHKAKPSNIPFEPGMGFIVYSDGLTFNPAYHALFDRHLTAQETLEMIVDLKVDSNDDVAIVLGHVHQPD